MAAFLAAMATLTPYLDKHTVLTYLDSRAQRDRRIRRLNDDQGTTRLLGIVYYALADDVNRQFRPSRYGLICADLDRVVLMYLDPLQRVWPFHPLLLHREWPHWDPRLHLP